MSFLTENWPILLFAGVMIYMHLFMHRGHGRHQHRHHDHAAGPASGRADGAGNPVPEQPKEDRHRHGGC